MRAETDAGRYVKCPPSLADFNQKWRMSKKFSKHSRYQNFNYIGSLVLDMLLEKIRVERFYQASARLGTPLQGQKWTKIGCIVL
jgi:hypothetical protein